eukprot:TRINITY_DN9864_c0_g1_i10.p1 TRINITY_DN9864_c0_g1~~TRINITY_DN9864_c0_g1_i10.p1  ORF type:complete len:309 (+),score=40.48 TRINITY_DN9864_c0_g1_i10:1027-1953(+)
MNKVSVIIPTYNAGRHLDALLPALAKQGLPRDQFLVIDSSSKDDTVVRFKEFGATVHVIPQREFNHGGTRRMAAAMCEDSPILIFLTQDAIPQSPDTFKNIVKAFDDPQVGMAYGRQLPRESAKAIERHARLFNYSGKAEVRTFEDRARLGVKTTFCSDSFAAYRHTALNAVGSFPQDAFFAEDQIVSGQMLMAGYKLAYAAAAQVIHSHDYSIRQEFQRYFDVGVFHARNPWLRETFGAAEGEGMRFLKSELAYVGKTEPLALISVVIRTFVKYAGYRMGRMESRLSLKAKKRLSMAPHYWAAQMNA